VQRDILRDSGEKRQGRAEGGRPGTVYEINPNPQPKKRTSKPKKSAEVHNFSDHKIITMFDDGSICRIAEKWAKAKTRDECEAMLDALGRALGKKPKQAKQPKQATGPLLEWQDLGPASAWDDEYHAFEAKTKTGKYRVRPVDDTNGNTVFSVDHMVGEIDRRDNVRTIKMSARTAEQAKALAQADYQRKAS